MPIHCEVCLHSPPNGTFIGLRGNVISGVIRYTVNFPANITGIFGYIKGTGVLKIEHLQKKDEEGNPETEIRRETYLNVNIINENIISFLNLGIYEIPFSVELPTDIPPSLNYNNNGVTRNVTCNIVYHVEVLFRAFDSFLSGKLFRKEIKVIAALVPKLPMTSVIYGGDKALTQLFSSKKSYVKVKANVFNPVLRCGDQIKLQYEVINDTNVVIKGVKVKLVEVYTFKSIDDTEIVLEENVPDVGSKAPSIESGKTQEMLIDINLPVDRESLDFANIVSREYFVLIVVKLPMPHRNYEIKIPIQIGHTSWMDAQGIAYSYPNVVSTWESMFEESVN